MKKFVKLTLVAGALCCIAGTGLADLHLCSDSSITTPVNVSCGPDATHLKDTGFPIPAGGGCADNGFMPWSIVRQKLNPTTGNGVCDFYVAGQYVGTASVSASLFSGTVNSASVNAPYSTTPAIFPISGTNLTVTISETSK